MGRTGRGNSEHQENSGPRRSRSRQLSIPENWRYSSVEELEQLLRYLRRLPAEPSIARSPRGHGRYYEDHRHTTVPSTSATTHRYRTPPRPADPRDTQPSTSRSYPPHSTVVRDDRVDNPSHRRHRSRSPGRSHGRSRSPARGHDRSRHTGHLRDRTDRSRSPVHRRDHSRSSGGSQRPSRSPWRDTERDTETRRQESREERRRSSRHRTQQHVRVVRPPSPPPPSPPPPSSPPPVQPASANLASTNKQPTTRPGTAVIPQPANPPRIPRPRVDARGNLLPNYLPPLQDGRDYIFFAEGNHYIDTPLGSDLHNWWARYITGPNAGPPPIHLPFRSPDYVHQPVYGRPIPLHRGHIWYPPPYPYPRPFPPPYHHRYY